MAEYRYLVADLLTGVVKAELPLDNVQYQLILNRAGSFSATLPTRHLKATDDNLAPNRTAIYVERDGVILFGGIIWTRRVSTGETGQVTIGAEGLWSYWTGPSGSANRGRFLKVDKTYSAEDQLSVAQDLMAYSMGVTGSLQVTLNGETSGALVDRQYFGYSRTNIGAEIQAQAAEANGYDFSVESAWDGNLIANTFRLYYPTRGRQTPLIFELGTNISDVEEQVDGTTQAQSVEYVGAGTGDATLFGTANDFTLVGAPYPLFEFVGADTSNALQWALDAEAASYLQDNVVPFKSVPTLTAIVSPNIQPGVWVPGDQVRVKASDGCLAIDDLYRITSYTVNVDAQGGESVSMGFDGSVAA